VCYFTRLGYVQKQCYCHRRCRAVFKSRFCADSLHSSNVLISLDTKVLNNGTTSDILFWIINTFKIRQVGQ